MEDTTFYPLHPLILFGICAIKPSNSSVSKFHSSFSLSVFVLLELRQLNNTVFVENGGIEPPYDKSLTPTNYYLLRTFSPLRLTVTLSPLTAFGATSTANFPFDSLPISTR